MSHHLAQAKNLSYTYPDGTMALENMNFTITHGECVGLVGANGAGKSTLLLHFTGGLFASAGQMSIGHTQVTPRTVKAIRRSVGFVFQDPDDQLFMPTVSEDVAFGPLNQGLKPEEISQRVKTALAQAGCPHLADRPTYRLSMGEKRSVSIAGVLACEPNMLVMDEPVAYLDPAAREKLIELIRGFDHTRVIASHDLEMIRSLCNRVLILQKGKLLADGPVSLLDDEDLMRRAGLVL